MTPEDKQKADAWVILQSKDVVGNRIAKVVMDMFSNHDSARWFSRRLVEAERNNQAPPLKGYFEAQLERNLRMILAEGVQARLAEIAYPMIEDAVKRHAEKVSKELAELKKLKSKGPIGRR